MKCPIDEAVLQMTDRQGIEIDYCPQCRGVWLDRGELDKVIERSMSVSPAPSPPPSGGSSYPQSKHDDGRREGGYSKRKKKESFLGDLFDF
ncbi:MAG TPA: zf-TFIIB domain-containing protein [Nocardioidaceae bacterium]|nr:zf-TFIIB domain-containing protein [Nocardioidaceae bacterium]